MNRATIVIGLAGVFLVSSTAALSASDKIELKKAFLQGVVELTFTAQDEGNTVELKIGNLSSNDITIIVDKGKTPFEASGKFAVVAAQKKEIEVPANGEKIQKFDLGQEEPGRRWTSGSVTLRVKKK